MEEKILRRDMKVRRDMKAFEFTGALMLN